MVLSVVFASFIGASFGWSKTNEVTGYADLHTHVFANHGFGRTLFHGEAFNEEGIEHALQSCHEFHGPSGKSDNVGNLIFRKPGAEHGNSIFSEKDPWPSRTNQNHQQMYFQWIKRGYKGGLRLMVTHAVSNFLACKVLAGGAKDDTGCNDMKSVDDQVEGVYKLEQYIEENDGGWFKIVKSPKEAREVISKGNLAVVLGIEVDFLFDCKLKGCDARKVDEQLAEYRDLGIRHLFPVHLFNNGFAGTGYFNQFLQMGDSMVNMTTLLEEPCDEKYTGGLVKNGVPVCSPIGLTNHGRWFMQRLMQKNMIIDVDHMSSKALKESLEIAEKYDYPLVSGHSGIRGVTDPASAGEDKKTDDEILRIYRLGGMVAPIMSARGVNGHISYGGVEHNCDGSSSAWANAYLYVSDLLKKNGINKGIGFGSDFNGMLNLPSGRFGKKACNGKAKQAAKQNPDSKVRYPFTSLSGEVYQKPYTLKMNDQERVFDYNLEGLSHIGMMPEFMEDMRQQGLSKKKWGRIESSAETYIAMWEKAESKSLSDLPLQRPTSLYPYPEAVEIKFLDLKSQASANDPKDFQCPASMPCSNIAKNYINLDANGVNRYNLAMDFVNLEERVCTKEISLKQGFKGKSCICQCPAP